MEKETFQSHLVFKKRLTQYLAGGRVHSGILLAGRDAATKMALAKEAGKFLLCEKPNAGLACQKCVSCLKVDKEVHPDLLICREPEETLLKIEVIRELCQQMALTPMMGKAKVCIIEGTERMNSASANAFLKSLEEPGPKRFYWLLTSQISSLLPTLVSRCLRFTLPPETLLKEDSEFATALSPHFDSFVTTRKIKPLLDFLEPEEKTKAFVDHLLKKLHQEAIQSEVPYPTLELFENTLELERRLRSNANWGLMLEDFLQTNF
jgi:hypothetical protein